jgi:prophage regulatory protein
MNAHPTSPQPSVAGTPGLPMFLRIGVVMRITGLGRSTIYRLMAQEAFPHPVRLTQRLVAWRPEDLERWRDARLRATR